jgi:hypothetical protein
VAEGLEVGGGVRAAPAKGTDVVDVAGRGCPPLSLALDAEGVAVEVVDADALPGRVVAPAGRRGPHRVHFGAKGPVVFGAPGRPANDGPATRDDAAVRRSMGHERQREGVGGSIKPGWVEEPPGGLTTP